MWNTGAADLRLPPQVQKTAEQLGLGQDPTVLRLPDGLEVVGDSWFILSDTERLIIPNCVKKLEDAAFANCMELREVIFEPGSQLESIGNYCFSSCGIERMTVPRSVRDIGDMRFRVVNISVHSSSRTGVSWNTSERTACTHSVEQQEGAVPQYGARLH